MSATSAIQALKLHLNQLLPRLRESSFVKNILVIMSGSAAAQAIGFALTPLISRLFSPSDFGVAGSFGAVSSIIAAGVTLDYSQAIMLPKEKNDALNLFFVSCLCTVAVSIFGLLFCILVPAVMQGLMKTIGPWMLVLLVLSTMVSGLNNSFQAWCVRVKAFKHTSASQVIRSLSFRGAQIGFGFLKGGALGLILSNVLADLVASINLVRVLLPDLSALQSSIRWLRMKQLAKEYRDFPMYSASQNVINALSTGLAVLLLTKFYGISIAGAYAFGISILYAPMNLILVALRQVLFQKASETLHRGDSLLPMYVKCTLGLLALAFFPSLVLFIWAPEIFTWIFGIQWYMAGEFAQSLVIWLMFSFCNLPAVLFTKLIRIQQTFFFYDLILLAGRASSLVFGGLYLSASQCILLFSLVGAAMNLFLTLLVGHAVMKKKGIYNGESVQNSLMK